MSGTPKLFSERMEDHAAELRRIRNRLQTLSCAFRAVGNPRVSDELWALSEALDREASAADRICSDTIADELVSRGQS